MMLRQIPRSLTPWANRFSSRAATSVPKVLTLPRLPIFEALNSHQKSKPAIIHSVSGNVFTYGELLTATAYYKDWILKLGKAEAKQDLEEKRVAILVENGYDYVVSMLSIFAAGGIAVPLCISHPTPEMRHVMSDSTPKLLLTSSKYHKKSEEVLESPELMYHCNLDIITQRIRRIRKLPYPDIKLVDVAWADKPKDRGALIIYTSGTTGLPKGVVSTHGSLTAQSTSLVKAWELSQKDYLLHVLPLHHVHGIVNATLAPLFAGGTIEYLFPSTAERIWNRLTMKTGKPESRYMGGKIRPRVNLFMAVPTVYNRLLSAFPTLSATTQARGKYAVRSLRLAISGSAALPGSIKDAWQALDQAKTGGGTMLERYGMTEIGMALSQGLPLSDRMANSVGWPLPGVEARLVDVETGKTIAAEETQREGEIQIRGETVFREYWGKPEATQKEFVEDETGGKPWFKTGDVAVRDERGAYYIHGRASVDIIKSGGEKVSALEVERELLELPQISEAAVVALPDPDWGQRVTAIIVLSEQGKEESFGHEEMRKVMKERLANYKVPTVTKIVDVLKRNQMGKINKIMLVKEVFGQ